jgi:hypothetical protein
MATKAERYDRVRLFLLNWFAEYLSGQKVKNPKIWSLLQEQQRFTRVRVHVWEHEWRPAMRAVLVLVRHHPRRFVRGLQALISRVLLVDRGAAVLW